MEIFPNARPKSLVSIPYRYATNVEYEINNLGVEGIAEKLEMSEKEFEERLVSYLESFNVMSDLWEEVERKYWELVKE